MCLGEKTFRCQISGIERISEEGQTLYDGLVVAGRQGPEAARVRSEPEEQVIQRFLRSRQQHQSVYWQLSRLSKLRVLDLGYEYRPTCADDEW